MKRLFISGPAHGKVIDVPDDATHHVVRAWEVSVPGDTQGVQYTHHVYQFGTYHLPRERPWDPLVLLSVATPNGEDPVYGYSDIKQLARAAGFHDTECRLV